MDNEKKAAFVRKMGKKKTRLVKRKHFDGGGLAGLIGSAGGAGGTGYDLTSGTNADQINNAYNANQAALGNQATLANTLSPQAGTAVNAQNVLSGQFANQAQGNGPNVATNVLNQATGANVANQAALMAGQRGAGANPALLARQAAMAGTNAQQQAAGQAATTQAQQQIAAEQAGAQLANNQVAQAQGATTANTQANQGEQSILQGANTANNNVTGQLANTTAGQQGNFLSGALKSVPLIGSFLEKGGEVHPHKKLEFVHKMTKLGLQHFDDGGKTEAQPDSSPSEGPPTESFGDTVRDWFGPSSASGDSISEGISKKGGGGNEDLRQYQANGGQIQKMADGGSLDVPTSVYQAPQSNFQIQAEPGSTSFSSAPADTSGGFKMPTSSPMSGATSIGSAGSSDLMASLPEVAALAYKGGKMKSHVANYLAEGGETKKVPAMVSPGEIYLKPEQVHEVVHNNADPLKIGYRFPGKAKVKGDSKKNDFLPVDLDDGGVVIDREHVMSPEKAALFVHKSIARRRVKHNA